MSSFNSLPNVIRVGPEKKKRTKLSLLANWKEVSCSKQNKYVAFIRKI